MSEKQIRIPILEREDSIISADYETTQECCMDDEDMSDETQNNIKATSKSFEMMEIKTNLNSKLESIEEQNELGIKSSEDDIDGGRSTIRKRTKQTSCAIEINQNWAEHKNVAEGLMDIALLSANANQLRFLITYNNKASTYFISLGLIVLSLTLQVAVGIALIFKRRIKRSRIKRTHNRINEFLIGGVFMVTVVNVLLAAFTTTDNVQN